MRKGLTNRRVAKLLRTTLALLLCATIFSGTAHAGGLQKEPNDFVHKLGVNVNAEWELKTRTLTVSGNGKIEAAHWEALAKLFDSSSYTSGGWGTGSNFSIVFADRTVRFPDDTRINGYGFFENFKGRIILPSGLDTANVVNMSRMFHRTEQADPDVTGWDVRQVTDMSRMFSNAFAADPDTSLWRTNSLTDMQEMFAGARMIEELDLTLWGRMKDVDAKGAFLGMSNLKYLQFGGLKFEKTIGLNNFAGAYRVERLEGINKIDIIENPLQNYLFEDNKSYRVSLLCTVKFDSDGGTAIADAIVPYNTAVTRPSDPTRLGYEFVRWEKNGSAYNFATAVKEDITLKAVWRAITSPTPPALQGELIVKLRLGSRILEKTVGGQTSHVTMDAMPFIEHGRVMLPLRYAAEALGMGIDWDNVAKIVILKDKTNEVRIPIRSLTMIVNGQAYQSDVLPVLRNGRTFLSVSNIAKPLGLEHGKTIFWDNQAKEATFIRKLSDL